MLVVSILTMTLGNVLALWQNNIRRLLAYSSIAHAGYILIGVAVALADADAGKRRPMLRRKGLERLGRVAVLSGRVHARHAGDVRRAGLSGARRSPDQHAGRSWSV